MKKLYIAIAVCAMLLSTGCAASAEPVEQKQMQKHASHVTSSTPEITVEQVLNEYNASRKTVERSTDTDARDDSLSVAGCACQRGDSYILFPKVSGPAGDIINSAICDAVMERAERLGMAVFADYKVEYNRHGIFSLRMFLYDMYGDNDNCIDCVPLTFNSETGKLYRISDFFDSENQDWRGRIPDIITAQAADCQMVLLSDVLPISDDRPFYITDEAVVIMYDLYEIATYSAGEPEFEITVDDIAECLDETSALNVMLPTDETTEETQAETAAEAQQEEQPADTENIDVDGEEPAQEVNGEDPENVENVPEDTENAQDTENAEEQPDEDTVEGETEPVAMSEEELAPTEEAQ